jgi:hypothetical protein
MMLHRQRPVHQLQPERTRRPLEVIWDIFVAAIGIPVVGLLFSQQRSGAGDIIFGPLITFSNNWLAYSFHAYQTELYPIRRPGDHGLRDRRVGIGDHAPRPRGHRGVAVGGLVVIASGAKQSRASRGLWIASSTCGLLAMTSGQPKIAIVKIWAITAIVIGHTMMKSSKSRMVTPSRHKQRYPATNAIPFRQLDGKSSRLSAR